MARNAERIEDAWRVWHFAGRPGGTSLAKIIGTSQTNASRWIRGWEADEEALEARRREAKPLAA